MYITQFDHRLDVPHICSTEFVNRCLYCVLVCPNMSRCLNQSVWWIPTSGDFCRLQIVLDPGQACQNVVSVMDPNIKS